MLTHYEKEVLLGVLDEAWKKALTDDGSETAKSERISDVAQKVDEMDSISCEACGDTGETWTIKEDEEGRDIDVPVKCRCKNYD